MPGSNQPQDMNPCVTQLHILTAGGRRAELGFGLRHSACVRWYYFSSSNMTLRVVCRNRICSNEQPRQVRAGETASEEKRYERGADLDFE